MKVKLVIISLLICFKGIGQNITADTMLAGKNYRIAKKMIDNRIFNKKDSILIYSDESSQIYSKYSNWNGLLNGLSVQMEVYVRNYQKEAVFILFDSIYNTSLKHFGKGNKFIANAYFFMGMHYYLSSQSDLAIENYNKALEIRKKLFGENNIDVSICYNSMGVIYELKSDFEKALEFYNKALVIRKKLLGEENLYVASCYNNIGLDYRNMSDYEKALDYLMKALAIRKKIFGEFHFDVAQSYNSIAMIYYDKSDYDKALQYYLESATVLVKLMGEKDVDVATNYNNIGTIYKKKSDYPKALEYYTKALSIRKELLGDKSIAVAGTYNDIGLMYDHLSEYDKALDFLLKSMEIKKSVLGEKDVDVAISYNNVGSIYSNAGEYDKALEYFLKSLEIRRELLGENSIYVAECYCSIGLVYYFQSNYTKALEFFMKDLNINLKILGETHEYIAESYLNIGLVYEDMKEFDKAIEYYQKSLEIEKKLFGESHEMVAKLYNNLGTTYHKLRNYKEALVYCTKSLKIKKQIFGNKSMNVALAYFNIGDIYYETNQGIKALEFYQKSICSSLPNYIDSITITSPSPLKSTYNYSVLLWCYAQKALVFEELADSIGTRSINLFGKKYSSQELNGFALLNYQLCDSIIIETRKKLDKANDKIALGENANDIYKSAIRFCYKMSKSNKDKRDSFQEEFYYFTEQSKGIVLLEALANAEGLSLAGIPDTLMKLEHGLRLDIAYYESKLAEGADSTTQVQYQSNLFKINRQYENLIAELEKNYPEYYKLKYSNKIPTIKDFQKIVDDKTAIRSYFVGDTTIYISTLTRNNISIKQVNKLKNFEDSIQAYRLSLSGNIKYAKDYSRLGFLLYKQLFPAGEEINPKIENLVIIPDGSLAFIPFESLPMSYSQPDKGGAIGIDSLRGFKKVNQTLYVENFKNFPFLIKRFNVSYSYSATLFYQNFVNEDFKQQTIKNRSLLAIAPVFSDNTRDVATKATRDLQKRMRSLSTDTLSTRGNLINGEYVSPLPGTELETSSILKEFTSKGFTAKVLLKGNANEKSIKSGILEKYSILHFATHGFVNSEMPELSGILLAQDTSGGQDGILYTGELLNFKLKADLTVLSACETGLGKVKRGEGIIGLTRALLYAGSKNIIVSLWQVSDQSTSDLMINFYKNLLKGKKYQSYSQWLRQAKLKMIDEGKFSSPFYWSPFILVGK